MILSLNRRFVFVHVHKCAGTSIEVALAPLLAANDLIIGSTAEGEKHKKLLGEMVGLHKHSGAAAARALIGAERWKNFYTFGFVRHPIDRLYSLYTYAIGQLERKPMTLTEAEAYALNGELPSRPPYCFKAAQAAFASENFDAFLRDPRCWQDDGAKPQWQSLCDEDGQRLVKFVGHVERIDKDWQRVQNRMGVTAPIGVQNKSLGTEQQEASPQLAKPTPPRGWHEEELSAQAWAMIKRHCLRDFRIFGYALPAPLQRHVERKSAAQIEAAAAVQSAQLPVGASMEIRAPIPAPVV
ncbi:MAG TPA: sulfotransferase family 2 domain-containing protein [Ideonella sp.]|uniref:sulfotransferase family 2 domain-containing protein n=1 Tax=Ideonella sp. TaxID=1929293 RepID=UPI002C376CA7|nr:sulfotransferase family 2 domain-containing protein [Ideonella sp.]HSI50716.1 sulfotransferase family 2 domain-containing protein [Ideonella sp.]